MLTLIKNNIDFVHESPENIDDSADYFYEDVFALILRIRARAAIVALNGIAVKILFNANCGACTDNGRI